MNERAGRYDVTVTVARDGYLPDPAEFAVAAEQAASSRAASVVSAHTAEQIIGVVTVRTSDRSSAVAIALAVVSEALRCPAVSPSSSQREAPAVTTRETTANAFRLPAGRAGWRAASLVFISWKRACTKFRNAVAFVLADESWAS